MGNDRGGRGLALGSGPVYGVVPYGLIVRGK